MLRFGHFGVYKTRATRVGLWVITSAVISKVIVVTTHVRGLKTILITTYEPPSRDGFMDWRTGLRF